jgi:hypothetical protein
MLRWIILQNHGYFCLDSRSTRILLQVEGFICESMSRFDFVLRDDDWDVEMDLEIIGSEAEPVHPYP